MKLHLPVLLRKALLACFAFDFACSATAADLTLGGEDSMTIDYAATDSILDLAGGTLTLSGDTILLLSNCDKGDGKTYTIATGISALLDADGNEMVFDATNNAISNYFDTTQPGTGFWAEATLQLTDDGTLQMVRHNQAVKEAVEITARQTGSVDYRYYAGVSFRDIDGKSAGVTSGGAINGMMSKINFGNNGIVEFIGNTASVSGGAMWSAECDNTGIIFVGNSGVVFRENRTGLTGGAIHSAGASLSVDNNGSVEFSGNWAGYGGGAIYGSNILLSSNGSVSFCGNSSFYGGAIHAMGNRKVHVVGEISLSDNGNVLFRENLVSSSSEYTYGGAIYGWDAMITLNDNGNVEFVRNSAQTHSSSCMAYGGAICAFGNLSIQNNDSVEFYQNTEVVNGEYRLSSIVVGGSGNLVSLSAAAGKHITFRDSITIDEGNIFNLNADYGTIKQKGDILFTGANTVNDLYIAKGYIAGTGAEIQASRTSVVSTMTNLYGGRLRVEDGAIYKGYGITAMEGSESTVFVKDATLDHQGYELTFNAGTTLELVGTNTLVGHVNLLEGSTLAFSSPETLGVTTIQGNLTMGEALTVSGIDSWQGENNILLYAQGDITGWNADNITIQGATANTLTWVDDLLVLNYNEETFKVDPFRGDISYTTRLTGDVNCQYYESVSFKDITNAASSADLRVYARGGAIYGSTITLSENGSVTFSGNTASVSADAYATARGGAIYSYGNLNIQNNESVLFEKNAEITNGTYRLRSIYVEDNNKHVISLSAAEGKSIEFRDSVYIGSGATVNLNADYTDAAGVVHKQAGDILYTGAYTETHLNDLLDAAGAGRTATEQEILNSRTSEVYAMTNLYGGRLRVEDGAIYKGYGITAEAGSASTVLVKDATLDHQGYELTFNAGTTLELVGTNSISGNVQMLEGSALRLVFNDPSATGAVLTLNDSLTLKKGSLVEKVGSDDKLTLQGGGKLCLDGGVDFSAFALGKEWTGTVKLANITADTNLIMNTIGQAGSTIELENVMGYTGVNGKTVAANLVLTRSYDANGTEQAAFRVSNGYSNAASDYVMTTFSGTVSGAGKMVFDKTLSGVYTGYKFTGDVAGWTGAFEMNAGRTFNLVFGGSATEIKADIRNISSNGTLNLVLQANDAMIVKGDVVTDSISVTNGKDVSFFGMVNTGALTAENSNITIASVAEVSGDMTVAGLQVQNGGSLTVGGELSASGAEVSFLGTVNAGALTAENSNITIASDVGVSGDMTVAGLHLQSGSFLTVGGTLCAGEITMDTISANSSALMVGQFGAWDTIFHLDIDDLNALNLGHGESVTIARAENTIDSDFNAWLGEGMTSLDAAVYRYDISVSGTDVQVSMDYANWGMRVWYQNAWVGLEGWDEYLVVGYDAVDGTETVDLGGETVDGVTLLIAPGAANAMTVLSHGEMVVEMAEVVDGQLQIAADATLDTTEMAAEGKEIHLLGELKLSEGRIGTLSGTTGKLSIASGGEVSIDSSVTLGTLTNSGTLDIGKNKLNVAAAVTTGGNVIAGEVVVHNRANKAAVFNALVADKVTVTNSLSSNSYKDAISLGDGSVIGELIAETLEVRGGTVTLGRTEGSTSLTLQGLDLQNDATLLLNQQTQLAVTESMSATENATVQLKQGAGISYGATTISNGGSVETTTVNAYELATGNLKKVENAHVAVDSDADTTVDYQLVNATLEKRGKGTLTVTSEGNSINAVSATGGTINVMNVASSDLEAIMKLASLELQDGATFGAYVGSTVDAAAEATVQVTDSAVFGSGTTINADLELMDGCSLTLNGPVNMGSNLKINGTITLNGDLLAQILSAELDTSFVLFSGIDNLYLHGTQYESISLSDQMSASTYFAGLNDDEYRRYWLTYESTVPGAGVLSVHVVVPEPATTTLSLLALAALVARRRRR